MSICLSDIPAEKRKKANNGKIYANITVAEMKSKDEYGNSHTVFMSQTKYEREGNLSKIYIGKGKEFGFEKKEVSTKDVDNMPQADERDLPF